MMDAKIIKKILSYNPKTGEFRWKVNIAINTRMGSVAGRRNLLGYWIIKYKYRGYRRSRLAWLYMKRRWPKDMIDHINGEKSDDRWENLREATRSQNLLNSKKPRSNTSGYKGVTAFRGDWRAIIRINGKQKVIGRYKTKIAAHLAYVDAVKRHHGEFGRLPS